jgi:hypothetical protein
MCIASTAPSTDPYAVTTITATSGMRSRSFVISSMPPSAGIFTSVITTSGGHTSTRPSAL